MGGGGVISHIASGAAGAASIAPGKRSHSGGQPGATAKPPPRNRPTNAPVSPHSQPYGAAFVKFQNTQNKKLAASADWNPSFSVFKVRQKCLFSTHKKDTGRDKIDECRPKGSQTQNAISRLECHFGGFFWNRESLLRRSQTHPKGCLLRKYPKYRFVDQCAAGGY